MNVLVPTNSAGCVKLHLSSGRRETQRITLCIVLPCALCIVIAHPGSIGKCDLTLTFDGLKPIPPQIDTGLLHFPFLGRK